MGGAISKSLHVPHGVPQGSVLGPLLILTVANDLHLNGCALKFADDSSIITRGMEIDDILAEAGL